MCKFLRKLRAFIILEYVQRERESVCVLINREWFPSDKYIKHQSDSCYPRGRSQKHEEDSIKNLNQK